MEKVVKIFQFDQWELNNQNVSQNKVLYLYKILCYYNLWNWEYKIKNKNVLNKKLNKFWIYLYLYLYIYAKDEYFSFLSFFFEIYCMHYYAVFERYRCMQYFLNICIPNQKLSIFDHVVEADHDQYFYYFFFGTPSYSWLRMTTKYNKLK